MFGVFRGKTLLLILRAKLDLAPSQKVAWRILNRINPSVLLIGPFREGGSAVRKIIRTKNQRLPRILLKGRGAKVSDRLIHSLDPKSEQGKTTDVIMTSTPIGNRMIAVMMQPCLMVTQFLISIADTPSISHRRYLCDQGVD